MRTKSHEINNIKYCRPIILTIFLSNFAEFGIPSRKVLFAPCQQLSHIGSRHTSLKVLQNEQKFSQ